MSDDAMNRNAPITLGLRVQLPWETDAGTTRKEAEITGYGGPLVRVRMGGATWYRHADTVHKQLSVSHA